MRLRSSFLASESWQSKTVPKWREFANILEIGLFDHRGWSDHWNKESTLATEAEIIKTISHKVEPDSQKHRSLQSPHTAIVFYSRISYSAQPERSIPSHQARSPQHHDRLLPLFPHPLSSLYVPVLLLIPARLSASNLSIPSLVACNTLSCLSHIASGRLGCAMNSSAPKAFPDGECTIPPLGAFGEINR